MFIGHLNWYNIFVGYPKYCCVVFYEFWVNFEYVLGKLWVNSG